ncbi:phosphopantetheine-binding protein [Bacillus thuringiensis]|uniref:Acyl carrier protein n=3 Tax=Bacillus cereus group TaxID=86661 RepID=A0A9W5K2S4_BACC8|nr:MULTISPECIES: phosphopantetheine-binding protein [Bacillus]MED1157985.1 phosphopantetheine-binding protein [Bacillus paranthracis]HCF53010.1 acyl carrier protein [Bacillus sp. (in: firmicutes)]HDX9578839.1 acyl carrier protein [Bacillus pseudomycoides]AJH03328.1 phosphopantetheine attachment site family protein [Bacillus thuringiensis HD1002]APF32639.1 acyl carrier protein [Bacillus thuringiensis serovar israelensis]
MENYQLEAQVLESIIKRLGIENITDDVYTQYYNVPIFSADDEKGIGLGLDSIDAIEIIIAIKEDFDVKIGDEDMEALQNVSSIADFIKNKK